MTSHPRLPDGVDGRLSSLVIANSCDRVLPPPLESKHSLGLSLSCVHACLCFVVGDVG